MALFKVHVQGVLMHDELPQVVRSWDIGGLTCQISGDEEIDLLYHLTAHNSGFDKMMKRQADGKYRMLVLKEVATSKYRREHGKKRFKKPPPVFGWQGWALFHKNKDQVFLDNRFFQIGQMNPYNLDVDPRDVQAEVKRTNWGKVPGGGLPRPLTWDKGREQEISDRIKSRTVKYY